MTQRRPGESTSRQSGESRQTDTSRQLREYRQTGTSRQSVESRPRTTTTNRRRKKRKRKKTMRLVKIAAIIAAIIAVIVLVVVIISGNSKKESGEVNTEPGVATASVSSEESGSSIAETSAETEVPTESYVLSTATIGATGDLLTHNSVLYSVYDGYGNYDFTHTFAQMAPYWSAIDYMVVNLEVPCSGSEGEKGSQYPTFDAPDSLVTALQNAGVDMFLTATNHTYDCRDDGLFHTQELINSLGLDHIGTRLSNTENFYKIKDINGIKFGMACYTYDTRSEITDDMSLNAILLNDESVDLVNTFCYSDAGMAEFYSKASADIEAMNAAGCDVKVFFMHWGTEYADAPSDFIRSIAANLSNLGVDLIIGGHPHVIQPFEVITGTGGNTTYCLYSTGNALSSQRKEVMDPEEPRGYTEDGITISFTYEKWSDGTTRLKDLNMLPTWVDADDYTIVPLDDSVSSDQWATGYTDDAIASYERTVDRVGQEFANLKAQLGN